MLNTLVFHKLYWMPVSRPLSVSEAKRTAYLVGLSLAVPCLLTIWAFRTEDPFTRYLYPLFAVLCAAWALRLWKENPFEAIEQEVTIGAGLFFCSKFLYDLYLLHTDPNHWRDLEGTVWGLAYVMVLVYMVVSPRLGLGIGLGMVGFTAVASLTKIGFDLAQGTLSPDSLYLLRNEIHLLLMAVLLYIISTIKDRLALMHRQVQEMHLLARTDPLTGLPNRLALSERLEAALEQPFGTYVALLDVDHFKRVNDQFGHSQGDKVLQEVAHRLRSRMRRKDDLLGRWGGEEFLIVMQGDSQLDIVQAVERLREEIAIWPFERVGAVSASFGVAEGIEGDSLTTILERADKALYRAKRSGRNRVEI